jgi:DNA mismatch endonuclease (patch repair protein)
MDVHTKEQRSYNMSRVKSENTKPEKLLYSILRKEKYQFIPHCKSIPGKPDAIIKKYKIAIFVDGEFWHGKKIKDWKNRLSPFWLKKITDNINRDKIINKKLKSIGWTIIRYWGREITKKPEIVQKRLLSKIKQLEAKN